MELGREIDFDKEEWQEATHKSLYKAIKSLKENRLNIKTEEGKDINWKKIIQTKYLTQKTITNEELIVNYKTAYNAYIFGNKKRSRNITHTTTGKALDLKCKFCNADNDDAKHILTSCSYTKKIITHLEKIIGRSISTNNILFNIGNRKMDWTILSIYKKNIINFKISLDIENRKVADENITKKIINKIKRRVSRITADTHTNYILDNIDKIT